MKRLALAFPLCAALVAIAGTAAACPTFDGGNIFLLGLFFTPFLAAPYAAFASMVIAFQRRSWFRAEPHRFWSWLKTTFAAWFFTSLAAAVAMVVAIGLEELFNSGALNAVVIFTTPLVGAVAYLMRLHTRRVAD